MRKLITYIIVLLSILVVIGLVLNLITSRTAYRITALNIANQPLVSPFETLVFTFNKPLTEGYVQNCSATTQPNVPLERFFKGQDLSFSPTPHFDFGLQYTLTLNCPDNLLLTTQFNTPTQENLSQEDINSLQTLKDFSTAQTLEKLFKENPWRLTFPVITEEYDLVYSQEEDRYYGYYKLAPNSSKNKVQIQIEAKEKLQELEAPPKEIVWQ